jgi:CheY-like chemotaxis protein
MTRLDHDLKSTLSKASEPKRLSVLLVEDDENEVYFLRTLFSEAPDSGLTFTWAATCAIAFEKLQRERFDVVLLDLNLTDSFGPST